MEKQEIAIRNISNSDYYCLLKQKKDYWQNIDYLEAEWSFQDVVNFIQVDYTIALLDKKNIEFFLQITKA
jgi:hypothetical protein